MVGRKKQVWNFLKSLVTAAADDHLSVIAAGVAFYTFLAFIPALSLLMSLWGLFADAETLQAVLMNLRVLLPQNAYSLVEEHLSRLSNTSTYDLGWQLVLSLAVTLWSARRGIEAIIEASHMVYREAPARGFIETTVLSLLITLGFLVVSAVVIAILVALPVALAILGADSSIATIVSWVRWPIVGLMVAVSLLFLYRYTPGGETRWQWVIPGATIATIGWLAISASFSFYVANFGNYNETYGTLGSAVALMLWFWVSAFVVLVGAEINSQVVEHFEERDEKRKVSEAQKSKLRTAH